MHASFSAFLVICFLLTITPGADTALVLKSSLDASRKTSVCTTLGICAGLLFHASLSSFGLSAILKESAELYHTIKLIGAAYLAYLGLRSLWTLYGKGTTPAARDGVPLGSTGGQAGLVAFRSGLFTNILNPKVAVFYLTFLPQFVNANGPVLLQSLLLASVHIAMSFVWLCLIAYFVTFFKTWLLRPTVKRKIESITALALIGFGARLALSKD